MLMRVVPDFSSLRTREFGRLDATGLAYLDYTGAALYPASLVRRDRRRLSCSVFGNPHSDSEPSLSSTEALESARRLTLRLLDADPAEYTVIFTANATAAIRIVAESFPFTEGSRLVMTADNHNSVNGLRVRAAGRRADVEYVPLEDSLRAVDPLDTLKPTTKASLFAFPAQSNFSGVRHPLAWIAAAHDRGYRVLLDAAALVPTSALSLTAARADFVSVSFYKLFGYPTGVGALVARHDALRQLRRRYFGGGTVQFVSVRNRIARAAAGASRFEDGTPNFLAMPAVADGLRWLRRIGLRQIERHTASLTRELLTRLHSFGDSVVVYGPSTASDRGGTVTFNLRRGGRVLPFEEVERAARDRKIAIRGGCFCNPGAAEHAFGIPGERLRQCLSGAFSVPRLRACLGDRAVGAVRASIGIPTIGKDLDRLEALIAELTC